MRILLSYGLVGRGGDAVQTRSLIAALHHLGHDVHPLGPTGLQPYQFSNPWARWRSRLRQLPWWAKDGLDLALNLWFLPRLVRALRDPFDLVFDRANLYDPLGLLPAAVLRPPLIVYLDSPWPLERQFRGAGHFQRLHRRAMRALGERARCLVTVSQASKAHYVELGLPAEKIVVYPNGIPATWMDQGRKLARDRRPFAVPPWTVGFVGSLSRWHRLDLLLEALARLQAQEPGRWRLSVVGYGEDFARLQALAKALDLERWLTWHGPLSHREAFEQIARFDVGVLPGTLSTGAPMKLFEYAALARPIVAPDLANLREWFSDEDVCFVPPDDAQALAGALQALGQDPQRAVRLGLSAQSTAAGYTWEAILAAILERAVGKGD